MATKTWTNLSGGRWQDDVNWMPSGTPSAVDDAIIVGLAGSGSAVTGPGVSASLGLRGGSVFSGAVQTGVLTVGASGLAASLEVAAGLLMASSLVLTGPSAVVTVDSGGNLKVGGPGLSSTNSSRIQVDAEASISGAGTIDASIYTAGTITAIGGTLALDAQISGPGQFQIGSGATLSLFAKSSPAGPDNLAPTETVAFAGHGATFTIGATRAYNGLTAPAFHGTIVGFEPGDTISLLNEQLSSATYSAGSGGSGSLILSEAGLVTGSLGFAGDYSGYRFVPTTVGSRTDITLVSTLAPSPGVLFDAAFYLASNPDVAAAGLDAYKHYIAFGWREGRAPDALFDPGYYLWQNPDVKAAGVDPLAHYQTYGWREGRDPGPLFSIQKYRATYPDMQSADPLKQYLESGQAAGRTTFLVDGIGLIDPLVNPAFYDAQLGGALNPSAVTAQQDAERSFHGTGWQQGFSPNALFDTAFYLSHNPDVAAAHVDPLLHFETYGWREGRDPSAQFSTGKYLAAYSDVRAASVDPLLHYVQYGIGEGRSAFAV